MKSKLTHFDRLSSIGTRICYSCLVLSPCFTKYVPETLKSQLFHSSVFCGNIPKTSYKGLCNAKFVKKYGNDKIYTPVVEDINKLYENTE